MPQARGCCLELILDRLHLNDAFILRARMLGRSTQSVPLTLVSFSRALMVKSSSRLPPLLVQAARVCSTACYDDFHDKTSGGYTDVTRALSQSHNGTQLLFWPSRLRQRCASSQLGSAFPKPWPPPSQLVAQSRYQLGLSGLPRLADFGHGSLTAPPFFSSHAQLLYTACSPAVPAYGVIIGVVILYRSRRKIFRLEKTKLEKL